MKLLIISGTPKKEGICHSLVKIAENTAIEIGAETEVVKLTDYAFMACKMCDEGWGQCLTDHLCRFGDKDGFNALQQKFKEADAFVFITPVYWGEASEAFKTFFNKLRRCQATKQWDGNDTGDGSYLAGKLIILVASAGGSGNGILSTLTEMERSLGHMNAGSRSNIYDYICVNRWNQEYKRETLKLAVTSLIQNGRD